MRKLILFTALLVMACGTETTVVDCTVTEADSCAVIVCPNGDPVTVCDGADGQDGAQGDTGAQGPPGQPGQDGQDGAVTSVTYLDFQPTDEVNVLPGGSEECIVDGPVAVGVGEGVMLYTTFFNLQFVEGYRVYLRVSADGTTTGDPISQIPIPQELTGATWRQKFVDVLYLDGWSGDLYLHVCVSSRVASADGASVFQVRSTVMTVTP